MSEKTGTTVQSRVKPSKASLAIGIALIAAAALIGSWTGFPLVVSPSPALSYLFSGTSNASGIHWTVCPDDRAFQCGWLTVPMNYVDPANTRTVSIAMRKYPATCRKSEYIGSLFVNPGVPGASGSGYVIGKGRGISAIVKGRYDIIGFDPRGVNMTSPAFNCSGSIAESAWTTFVLSTETMPLEGRNGSLLPEQSSSSENEARIWRRRFARDEAVMKGCQQQGDAEMMKSASTAFIARDMVSMLKAVGETTLHYWGFSYGTTLGSTFAAMFPDRVGRMVLDGVMDTRLYTQDWRSWGPSNFLSAENVLEAFGKECDKHPAACALAGEQGVRQPAALLKRLSGLASTLVNNPLPVPVSKFGPGILTATLLHLNLVWIVYKPTWWPAFASNVAAAEQGDGRGLFEFITSRRPPLAFPPNPFGESVPMQSAQDFLTTAIVHCADSNKPSNPFNVDAKIAYANGLAKASINGDFWMGFMSRREFCELEHCEAYRGPWTAETGLKKTRFPLLFVANIADPVTPLASAIAMSENFGSESATLLINEGYGHCSLAQPSICTAKTIRAYFLDGIVPGYNTTCASQQSWPFAAIDYDISKSRRIEC